MSQISFDNIKAAIAQPEHKPTGMNLKVSKAPEPFVAPMFDQDEGLEGALGEIVLIRASAAVGKSTIARALSAARQIPVLDLAKVAVATGSLKGILGDLRNGSSPIDAFHNGDLPIIVDALDEGRLLSGDTGFFSFLETSAETILESRRVRNRPKLILLGRPDAVSYAHLVFSSNEISLSILDVGYFDYLGARQLIHAYASQAATPASMYFVHTDPVERYITAYFDRIEDALGLERGELWCSETGLSFAGYAPVLAAIGSLLPEIENFAEALNRLNDAGAADAWSVIETVLDEIISRDQRKFVKHAESGMSERLPPEAYDKQEQLALLLQYVQRQPLTGGGRVHMAPNDIAKYEVDVSRWIQEHPFLRKEELSNDVIASFVFAAAISTDQSIFAIDRLAILSRQPFLWRSLAARLNPQSLIDGKYLGFVLNSFWNDPLTVNDSVDVRALDDEGATVTMKSGNHLVEFVVALPIIAHGQLRNSDVRVQHGLVLEGAGEASTKSFLLENTVIRSLKPINLQAAKLYVANDVWLDADVVRGAVPINLEIEPDARYYWGEELSSKFPFDRYPSTLDKLDEEVAEKLERLLTECANRFPPGVSLLLHQDYNASAHDKYMQWVRNRRFEEFPLLIQLIVKHGFAQTRVADSKGKVAVKFTKTMEQIRDGVLNATPPFADLAADLRKSIK